MAEESIKQQRGETPTRGEFNSLQNIMYLIVGVFAVAFLSFLFQTFWQSQSAYNNLSNLINQQTAKIDSLYNQCYLSKPKI